jgi:hypothetical protein
VADRRVPLLDGEELVPEVAFLDQLLSLRKVDFVGMPADALELSTAQPLEEGKRAELLRIHEGDALTGGARSSTAQAPPPEVGVNRGKSVLVASAGRRQYADTPYGYMTAREEHAMNRHFIRHYIEMLIAMALGMVVLGTLALAALSAAGISSNELHNDLPALMLLGMAVTMTVPMVAWMRYRGHGWAPSNEMALSMFIPTFAVIGLLWAGLVTDMGTLMIILHVAMLPAMLLAMLLRREEYSDHHGAAHQVGA